MSFLYITRHKQKWNQKYGQLSVGHTLQELFFYIIFLITVSIVAFGMSGSAAYYFSRMMNRNYIEREFSTSFDLELDYDSISLREEFWLYAEQILFPTSNSFRNINERTNSNKKLIFDENLLIGNIRFRQIRVRNDSCSVHILFKNHFHECYGSYSTANEFKLTLERPNGIWNYRDANRSDTNTWGMYATYPGGGYIEDISNDILSLERIKYLKEIGWFDRGTRVLFVEFTIYNANSNIFCIAKLIIEQPPSGGVRTSHDFRTVKLLRFASKYDYFVLIFEVLYAVQVVWYTIEELYEFSAEKLNYFSSFWNWIDLGILTISYSTLSFSLIRYKLIKDKLKEIDKTSNGFIGFGRIGYQQVLYNNSMAICIFLVWVKMLKFISFNQSMLQFSTTLKRCAKDLLGFGVMFFIVFVAFAQLGFMLFGTENKDFMNFKISMFTLMRTILGDFDYLGLEKTNRILGPIYFITFIFFVFFVLLNMFLAIINDTYSEVKSEPAQNTIHLENYFIELYNRLFGKFCRKKLKIKHEDSEIKIKSKSEINDDGKENELKKYCEYEISRMQKRIKLLEISIDEIVFKLDKFIANLRNKKNK